MNAGNCAHCGGILDPQSYQHSGGLYYHPGCYTHKLIADERRISGELRRDRDQLQGELNQARLDLKEWIDAGGKHCAQIRELQSQLDETRVEREKLRRDLATAIRDLELNGAGAAAAVLAQAIAQVKPLK